MARALETIATVTLLCIGLHACSDEADGPPDTPDGGPTEDASSNQDASRDPADTGADSDNVDAASPSDGAAADDVPDASAGPSDSSADASGADGSTDASTPDGGTDAPTSDGGTDAAFDGGAVDAGGGLPLCEPTFVTTAHGSSAVLDGLGNTVALNLKTLTVLDSLGAESASVTLPGRNLGVTGFAAATSGGAHASGYITGDVPDFGVGPLNPGSAAFIVRYDASARAVWSRGFAGRMPQIEMTPTANDGVALIGFVSSWVELGSVTVNAPAVAVAQLDATGKVSWVRSYPQTTDLGAWYSIEPAPNGDLLVAGHSSGISIDGRELGEGVFAFRLTPDGTVVWAKQLTTVPIGASSISGAADGSVYVTGQSGAGLDVAGSPVAPHSSWLLKLDARGERVWLRTFTDVLVAGAVFSSVGDQIVFAGVHEVDFNQALFRAAISSANVLQWEQTSGDPLHSASVSSLELRNDVLLTSGWYTGGPSLPEGTLPYVDGSLPDGFIARTKLCD